MFDIYTKFNISFEKKKYIYIKLEIEKLTEENWRTKCKKVRLSNFNYLKDRVKKHQSPESYKGHSHINALPLSHLDNAKHTISHSYLSARLQITMT